MQESRGGGENILQMMTVKWKRLCPCQWRCGVDK